MNFINLFHIKRRVFYLLAASLSFLIAASSQAKEYEPLNPTAPDRLPKELDGRSVTPEIGCFWSYGDDWSNGQGDVYKNQIDAEAPYGAFDAVLLTLRSCNTIVGNEKARDAAKKAAEYARERYGIGTLLDIDVRIARYDFEKARPDLAQERLLFMETEIAGEGEKGNLKFSCPNLSDHYTGNAPYFVRGGRVVKAWCYRRTADGAIDPGSVIDVSDSVVWDKTQYVVDKKPIDKVDSTSRNGLSVSFDRSEMAKRGDFITCAAAFRYSYPDLFADETLELEKKLYESFRDVPALGVGKDEWGFPPCFNRVDALDDYWYSERMRAAYAKKYGNRDLVDDLFLAFRPQADKNDERVECVDRFRRLCGDRVVEYEFQNYAAAKAIWGDDAFVGVHCTWYPWPNMLEMRKGGIMWWKAPRDVAQVDEYVPFCVRNSLAKACDSLWVNMFYANALAPYVWEHWTAAASGGRVHIHQIYPRNENSPTNPIDPKWLPIVADAGAGKIRQKIRMLNLVSNSQVDAPVAVIFGRFAASNPLRPEYMTVGVDVCDRLATRGYPADLTPIDEMSSATLDGKPRWTVNDGYLQYGNQKYHAVILNGESPAEGADYAAFRALAASAKECKTQIISLAPGASKEEKDALVEGVVATLKERGVPEQTAWVRDEFAFGGGDEISTRPPRRAFSRFLDGTLLWISAQENDLGDPIVLNKEKIALAGGKSTPEISAVANGVFAARFNDDGELTAVVASELKSLSIGEFNATLSEDVIGDDPIDVAIWKTNDGKWFGVFQRSRNELPEALEGLASTWKYLQRR